jgi:hypothetical protein
MYFSRLLVSNDELGGTFTTSVPLMGNMTQNNDAADAMAGAVSAAVAGALSAIVSAVGNTMGSSNITIVQQGVPLSSHNQASVPVSQGKFQTKPKTRKFKKDNMFLMITCLYFIPSGSGGNAAPGTNAGISGQTSGSTNSANETSGSAASAQSSRASPPSDNNGSPQRRQT